EVKCTPKRPRASSSATKASLLILSALCVNASWPKGIRRGSTNTRSDTIRSTSSSAWSMKGSTVASGEYYSSMPPTTGLPTVTWKSNDYYENGPLNASLRWHWTENYSSERCIQS